MLNELTIFDNMEEIINDTFLKYCEFKDKIWGVVISKLLMEFENMRQLNTTHKIEIAGFCLKLAEEGFKEMFNLSAKFYYEGNSLNKATKIWERNDNTNHRLYFIARSETTDNINERIHWIRLLQEPKKIIAEWKKANLKELTDETKKIIFDALLELKNFDTALIFDINIEEKITKLLNSVNKLERESNIKQEKENIVKFLLAENSLLLLKHIEDFGEVMVNREILGEVMVNREILEAIIKTKNWEKILNSLIERFPKKDFLKDFIGIIYEIENDENIFYKIKYAIGMIKEFNMINSYKLIFMLSLIKPEKIKDDIKIIEKFVLRHIEHNPNWKESNIIKEIEVLLDHTKSEEKLLDLYEYLIEKDEYDQKIINKWFLHADNRYKYLKKVKKSPEAQKLYNKIGRKKVEWDFNKIENFEYEGIRVHGYSGIIEKNLRRKRLLFELENYLITCSIKNINIEDIETEKIYQISIQDKKFDIDNIKKIEPLNNLSIELSGNTSNFIELYVESKDLTIKIEII